MEESYKRLLELANQVEGVQKRLKLAANALSCTTYLILMLIRYRFGLDDKNYDMLEAHFCPQVNDCAEQGWEEIVDASMTYLLRTVLAKNVKETAVVQQSVSMPSDTTKMRKHISIVCDRLNKGARLYHPITGSGGSTSKVAMQDTPKAKAETEGEKTSL
eukprot:CAMPEP_0113940832 /NCGR_PEP_ID=MMETSP1339-20121228/6885_1 /TAXON_ID=94617 /ORGANISM="Fibrocapsa japonica" /LENGTH=159 /DNA_ID=CAMNT_0000944793 /DNA_START=137 /DNA_END=616 /DNA_ORIENTATION=- /assembly_acc=CAM_ASM_000762